MSYSLSEGALSAILHDEKVDSPIVQILGSKEISGSDNTQRYRLLLSDGLHATTFAMLGGHLNSMMSVGDLADFSIIKMESFATSTLPCVGQPQQKSTRVLILLRVEVIHPGSEVNVKIGKPTALVPEYQPQPPPPKTSEPAAATTAPLPPAVAAAKGTLSLDMPTHAIASLTPYRRRWVIKARVTSKSGIRKWCNSKGEGKLFSFDLVDETGEIRVTAFRDQCDEFFHRIEMGKIYLISKCDLKAANKKFSNLNNDYEMTMRHDTQIMVVDNDAAIPQIQYKFTPLAQIEDLGRNALVDVIGVAKETFDIYTFVARSTNRELRKREVILVDGSVTSVNLTLWNQQAEDFDGRANPVLVIKQGNVVEFGGGKSVSMGLNSSMQINPDLPEARRLKSWYDEFGKSADYKSVSARVLDRASGGSDYDVIALREALCMGKGDQPAYFNIKGTVVLVKSENAIYEACPSENCYKKLVNLNNGLYRCEKCNRNFPHFIPRFLLSVCIGDWSEHAWFSVFQEQAEQLLGHTAEHLHGLKQAGDASYAAIVQKAVFKSFLLRGRVRKHVHNHETRVSMSILGCKSINHKDYAKQLLGELKTFLGPSASC